MSTRDLKEIPSLADVLARAESAIENWDLEAKNKAWFNATIFCEVAEYRYRLQCMGSDAPWESVEACDRMLLRLEHLQANPNTKNGRGDCARSFLDALVSLMHETGYTRRYVHLRRVREGEESQEVTGE